MPIASDVPVTGMRVISKLRTAGARTCVYRDYENNDLMLTIGLLLALTAL